MKSLHIFGINELTVDIISKGNNIIVVDHSTDLGAILIELQGSWHCGGKNEYSNHIIVDVEYSEGLIGLVKKIEELKVTCNNIKVECSQSWHGNRIAIQVLAKMRPQKGFFDIYDQSVSASSFEKVGEDTIKYCRENYPEYLPYLAK